jgi:hypothetical protein
MLHPLLLLLLGLLMKLVLQQALTAVAMAVRYQTAAAAAQLPAWTQQLGCSWASS